MAYPHPGASQDPFASLVGEALGGYQTGVDMQRQSRRDQEEQEKRRLDLERQAIMDKIFRDRMGYGDPTGQHSGAAGQAPAPNSTGPQSVDIGPSSATFGEDYSGTPGVIQETPISEAPQAEGVAPVAFPQGQPQLAERGVMGRVRELGGRVGRGIKERLSTFQSGGFQPFEPPQMPVRTGLSVEDIAGAREERIAGADRGSRELIARGNNETALKIAEMQTAAEHARINASITEQEFMEIMRAVQYGGVLTEQAKLQLELGDDSTASQLVAQAQSLNEWIASKLKIAPSAMQIENTFNRIGTNDTYITPQLPGAVGQNLRRGGGSTWE